MIFLGPLYVVDKEDEVRSNTIIGGSNAPNVFQWNLLKGLHSYLGNELKVLNVLPVGTWPRQYKKLFFKDNNWTYMGINGQEIGSINLPFLKQLQRSIRIKKILKEILEKEDEILIYSAYMPFLKAIYKLPKMVKITAIITDLPEFYDLGNVSRMRKILRSIQNKMIYKYLNRVDRFVVLTEQMCVPLKVGERPWICIEGICNYKNTQQVRTKNEKSKAIFYSGTLHYQYGITNLLEAFKLIEVDDVELWICGIGEAVTEIKELSVKDKRVKYFGFCTQEEVTELRQKAMVLVNPRTNEGEYTKYSFPSKTMEYMASGKPVVMYKLDGIPNEYDKYLFYAETDNYIIGLKSAIENVFKSYDDALIKADNAKTFVLENKNSIEQAKKILNLME